MPQVQDLDGPDHDAVGDAIEARVLSVNPAFGVAYLEEAVSGQTVGVSRDFIGNAAFELLSQGRQVQFRRNEQRIVTALASAG